MNRFILFSVFLFLTSYGYSQQVGIFTDTRDNKTYKTIAIEKSIWMAENLAYKTDNGCRAYEDILSNGEKYGYLYSYEAAQNVCPDGWRLPTKDDFDILLKTIGRRGRQAFDSLVISKSFGFSALFSGVFFSDYEFYGIHVTTMFWSSSSANDKEAWAMGIDYINTVTIGKGRKDFGYSVRCVLDK